MSATHLLSLADLHAAGPGVLDVIFGPDGDFEGAPEWRCPIWYTYGRPTWMLMREGDWCIQLDRRGHWVALAGTRGHISTCHLDLRTSAADRLAKLCARVCLKHIGVPDAPVSVYVFDDWELCGLEVYTSGRDRYRQRHFCWDGMDGGGNNHFLPSGKRDLFDLPVGVVARPQPDSISFLAALTLHLAPQIAALKDTP